jgi:hypothetical protein
MRQGEVSPRLDGRPASERNASVIAVLFPVLGVELVAGAPPAPKAEPMSVLHELQR